MTELQTIKDEGLKIIKKVESENRGLKENERLLLDQLLSRGASLNNQKNEMKNPIKSTPSVEKTSGLISVGEERSQKNIFGR